MFGTVSSHHGFKRRAAEKEDGPEDLGIEQPITKRLARMRIEQPPSPSRPNEYHQWAQNHRPAPAVSNVAANVDPDDDHMYLDDTRDRVYIHDLDTEIAQIEAEERSRTTIFIQDIDKKISTIPQRLLQNKVDLGGTTDTQVVLYQAPSSISVPKGETDHVQDAIMAARARAWEKQSREAQQGKEQENMNPNPAEECGQGESFGRERMVDLMIEEQDEEMEDADAMDLG